MKRTTSFLLFGLSCIVLACSSPQQGQPSAQQTQGQPKAPEGLSSQDEALNRFLWTFGGGDFEEYEGDKHQERYFRAFADLNGDGKDEAIVYIVDSCGSGGCSLLILTPTEQTYDEIGYVKIAQLPIRVLNDSSHGWHGLSFRSFGGGIPYPGNEIQLSFNSEVYEEIASAKNDTAKRPGKELIVDRQAGEEKTVFRPSESASTLASSPTPMALRQALQDYLRGRYFTVVHLEGSNPADFGYISAFKDLNGDGKEEAIVYLTGPDWWQSTVVLTPHGSSYRVMSHAALNPPIRVLPATSTDGWKKLSGRSPRGGGDMTLYETSFSFDGKRYTEDEKGKSPDRTPDSLGELAMERLDASQQGEPLFPKR